MRKTILRELAVQSLQGVDHDKDLQLDLIHAAIRADITILELIRERLLLKAGVSTIGTVGALVYNLAANDGAENGVRRDPPLATARVGHISTRAAA